VGAPVVATLTDPVYLVDRLVLPSGCTVTGHVQRLIPADKNLRLQAHLDGDVTPLHEPVVVFDKVSVPGSPGIAYTIEAHGRIRDTAFIRFTSGGKKPSLVKQAVDAARAQATQARDAVFAPGKKDRALRLLYSQLPYHPQRIWQGSGMIAELDSPAKLTLSPAEPTPRTLRTSLDHIRVDARLATDLTSATAKRGQPVEAVVTRPVLDSDHRLVVPEGAELDGVVAQVRPARSFGRAGQLRLAFSGIQGSVPAPAALQGTVVAAEGDRSANVSVDREGNVQAHPDQNRFVAPLLLALTAATGHDRDRDGSGIQNTTVASNGFGLVARVIALTVNDRNTAVGFGAYAFAKSVYFRWLQRGHQVTFPRDTLVEVELTERTGGEPAESGRVAGKPSNLLDSVLKAHKNAP
ncbi:MAG TPA: hypothetical protein VLI45_03045, partial [Acidobacteriaceae bacterium]|nr:hypothetical protein [Acidobacteriaceae bacterium]